MVCEVCGSEFGKLKLDLGTHPLCDDLTLIGSNVDIPKYQQLISLCEICLTAHQVVPVEKELLFKPNYHYRASLTKDVLDGMRSLVKDLSLELSDGGRSSYVLDIGCNDGSLLGIFKEEFSCVTIGVDPTGAILESGSKVDFKFNEYFSAATAKKIMEQHPVLDLITFTNVFAHIEDLPTLLANLGSIIGPETSLVIENHYLGAILNRNQFDTFYHEHPRTYSLRSFEYIAKSLGLLITDVQFPARYGGNIRVTMKKRGLPADLISFQNQEDLYIAQFSALQNLYTSWKDSAVEAYLALSKRGKIYGKALPGRAVMLINALGIDASTMPVIFEQPSSPKVGNYVPSTKIEVLSDADILRIDPQILIVWSWHIIEEIERYLDSLGYRGEIWIPLPEFKMYRAAL